jgi:hypothetical protein
MKKRENWQWAVLISATLQLISPGILTLLGYTVNSKESDPQITPANYTFTVWGIITILSFCYGIYQFVADRKNKDLHQSISRALTAVYLLFVCWLFAAVVQWLILTVIIFLVMFYLMTLVFERLIQDRQQLGLAEKIILFGQVAIYTGWATVAVFANSASAIKFYGLPDNGVVGILWQSFILILALVNSKYWLSKFQNNIAYGGTILWALVGVLTGLIHYDNNLPLKLIVTFGIFLVTIHLFNFDILRFYRTKSSR